LAGGTKEIKSGFNTAAWVALTQNFKMTNFRLAPVIEKRKQISSAGTGNFVLPDGFARFSPSNLFLRKTGR
jgi:hypothetical protein